MIYLTAQPDSPYFIWQLEVLDSNLRELGIRDKAIALLGFKELPTKEAIEYQKKNVGRVFLINDTRTELECRYVPSIRPHILTKFFEKASHLFNDEPVFYHDCDLLFREAVNIRQRKDTVYVSDTVSYIGAEYIKSKSDELFEKMCNIVGIDSKIVVDNELNSGGAQYLFPANFLTSIFWQKVDRDSVKLFNYLKSEGELLPLKTTGDSVIQSWTADMWGVLWNIWLNGLKTKVHKDMDFCWPMNPLSEWENKKIYHNAGVTDKDEGLFFKGKYIHHSPFDEDFSFVSKDKCTIKYVEQIIKCKKYL